jgi:hypothetical protein
VCVAACVCVLECVQCDYEYVIREEIVERESRGWPRPGCTCRTHSQSH